MTKKQIARFADKIYALELKVRDQSLSKEERENTMVQIELIVGGLMHLPDGFYLIGQIDEIIQKKFAK